MARFLLVTAAECGRYLLGTTTFAYEHPPQPQNHEPERRHHQCLACISLQREQHNNKRKEGETHPTHQLAKRHLVD